MNPNQECLSPVTVQAVIKMKLFDRASVDFVTNFEISFFLHLLEHSLIPFAHANQHYGPSTIGNNSYTFRFW